MYSQNVITSREFNQNIGLAQRAALSSPVIITNRGEPAFVLLTHQEYQRIIQQTKTAAEALTPSDPDVADIEFEIPPRSRAQRSLVEFD